MGCRVRLWRQVLTTIEEWGAGWCRVQDQVVETAAHLQELKV